MFTAYSSAPLRERDAGGGVQGKGSRGRNPGERFRGRVPGEGGRVPGGRVQGRGSGEGFRGGVQGRGSGEGFHTRKCMLHLKVKIEDLSSTVQGIL